MIETSVAYCWGVLVPLMKRIPSESPSAIKMKYKQMKISKVWDILLKKDIGGNKWTMAQIVSAQPDSCAKCSAEGDWCIEQKR